MLQKDTNQATSLTMQKAVQMLNILRITNEAAGVYYSFIKWFIYWMIKIGFYVRNPSLLDIIELFRCSAGGKQCLKEGGDD